MTTGTMALTIKSAFDPRNLDLTPSYTLSNSSNPKPILIQGID